MGGGIAQTVGGEMKQFSYFWLSMSLAFGIGGGLLIADGVRLATAAFAAKVTAAQLQEQREQKAAIRAQQAKLAREQEAERQRARNQRNRVYQHKKQQFKTRNEKLEVVNNYLQEIEADCKNAHALNRSQPSREHTLMADEACSDYEAEKKRLHSRTKSGHAPLRVN